MSTNAYIGYVDENDVVHYIYNHYDGYPSHMFNKVLQWYSEEGIKEIVSMGNVSYMSAFGPGNFVGEFYAFDRGESYEKNAPKTTSYKSFVKNVRYNVSYSYILKNNSWEIYL